MKRSGYILWFAVRFPLQVDVFECRIEFFDVVFSATSALPDVSKDSVHHPVNMGQLSTTRSDKRQLLDIVRGIIGRRVDNAQE